MAVQIDTKTVTDNITSWRKATLAMVEYLVEDEQCFSSGEIARELRLNRIDLKFSVLTMGEMLRDLFWASGMGSYVQVNRVATGSTRTPAGQPVYVYAPSKVDGDNHDFEVEVPLPPGVTPRVSTPAPVTTNGYPTQVTGYPTAVVPASTSDGGASTKPPVTAPRDGYTVRVLKDFRLCIRRSVFDRFIHLADVSVQPGQPVWVKVDSDEATVSFDPIPGGSQYQINEGRVIFPSQDNKPFPPGTTYPVTVTSAALTVHLSKGS